MRAVILAAGEGSRMGARTGERPKAFMDVGGRTLYDRQRSVLSGRVDATTAVLGYAAENVLDRVGDANVVIVEDWDRYDNAESLRRALADLDGPEDVLVLNGDVLVSDAAIDRLLARHRRTPDGRCVVACTTERREESTAIRTDERGLVEAYGLIDGHRHAGLGVIDADAVDRVRSVLAENREEWYPVCYPAVETEVVRIPPNHHVEINWPGDERAAEQTLPLASTGGADAES